MTLQDKQALHRDKVRNWTVRNLKADADFMQDCCDDESLREWVLGQRPDMAKQEAYKIKFLGLKPPTPPIEEKPAHVDPEPIEELSRTGEIVRDLKAYQKEKGFL
jgi:hypothetical protein